MKTKTNTAADAELLVESVERLLHGLGQYPRQLDGLRVRVPHALQNRMSTLLKEPWIFSPWFDLRLRLVPLRVWERYLAFVHSSMREPADADNLIGFLRQLSQQVSLDQYHRWDIPVTLADRLGIGGSNRSIVLTVGRFWLEIMPSRYWQQLLEQTLEHVREALGQPDPDLPRQ